MKRPTLRNYVVKKYVEATSVAQAIRISMETPVHEVQIVKDESPEQSDYIEAIGYQETKDEEYEVPDEYSHRH